MKPSREAAIEEAIEWATNTWEVSCDWNATVRAAKESLQEQGVKPTKPLVLYVAKMAKLALAKA